MLTDALNTYCWIFIFLIPVGVLQNYLIYKGDAKKVVIINTVTNLFKLFVSCLIIYFNKSNLQPLFLFLVLLQGCIFLIYIYSTFYRKKIQLHWKSEFAFGQLKNGASLASVTALSKLIFLTSGFYVSKLLSTSDYAIYRSGAFEVPVLSTFYAAITTIILPEIHKLWSQENTRSTIISLKRRIIQYSMLVNYPVVIFLIFNSGDLITLYLSPRYYQSAVVFAIYSLFLFIRVNDYEDVIIASKNSFIIFRYYLICFLFNSVIAYFLIKLLGNTGGAISLIITVILISLLELKKSLQLLQCNLNDLFSFKTTLKIISISLAIGTLSFAGKIFFLQSASLTVKVIFVTLFYFIVTYSLLYIGNVGHIKELKNIILKLSGTDKYLHKGIRNDS